MAHFYRTLLGSREQVSRLGTKASGVRAVAALWDGSIRVDIRHDSETGEGLFEIWQDTWHGQGINELIATGILGKPAKREAAD